MATQVGIGFNQLTDPVEAGRRAAQEALHPLAARDPDLIVLFTTTSTEPERILAGVRTVTGQAPLIGGSSAGIIVPSGAFRSGVAVLAFASDEIAVVTGIAMKVSENPVETSRGLVQGLLTHQSGARRLTGGLCLVLPGAIRTSKALVEAVEATGSELGPFCRLVGGGMQGPSGRAGDPAFFGDQMYGDALVGALFLTPGPTGIGVRHGYQPLGRPLVVTKVEGTAICELSGRSAFQAYVEQFPNSPELTIQNFGQFALDYPLGLPQMGREYIVRDPYNARPDGALECAGVVPEHSVVRIMAGNKETLLQSATVAATEALQALRGKPPLFALVFSCVSRLQYLGLAAQQEVAAMREALGSQVPFVGLFSYGELAAQLDSPATLHNKTVVIGTLGEP